MNTAERNKALDLSRAKYWLPTTIRPYTEEEDQKGLLSTWVPILHEMNECINAITVVDSDSPDVIPNDKYAVGGLLIVESLRLECKPGSSLWREAINKLPLLVIMMIRVAAVTAVHDIANQPHGRMNRYMTAGQVDWIGAHQNVEHALLSEGITGDLAKDFIRIAELQKWDPARRDRTQASFMEWAKWHIKQYPYEMSLDNRQDIYHIVGTGRAYPELLQRWHNQHIGPYPECINSQKQKIGYIRSILAMSPRHRAFAEKLAAKRLDTVITKRLTDMERLSCQPDLGDYRNWKDLQAQMSVELGAKSVSDVVDEVKELLQGMKRDPEISDLEKAVNAVELEGTGSTPSV